MSIGARIKLFREKNKISQTEMARALGVTSASLSTIEKGQTNPKVKNIIKLATIYGLDLNWLMLGQGDIYLNSQFLERKLKKMKEVLDQLEEL